MNRGLVALVGFLFLSAGISTAIYHTLQQQKEESTALSPSSPQAIVSYDEKIREGREFLRQSSDSSIEKAVVIFSELSSKNLSNKDHFIVRHSLGTALEKKGDRFLALEIFRDLQKQERVSKEDQEKLSYSLGSLLLKLNQESEGRPHIESVLRTSQDPKLRSKALASLADYQLEAKEFKSAKKNYELAIQEDPSNTLARIGWGRSLKKLGKDWAAYEVFDEYIDISSKMEKTDGHVVNEYKSGVFERGRDAYSKKQYSQAIEFFKKSIELGQSPGIVETSLYYIAQCHDALGNTTESFQYLNQVLNNTIYSLDQEALFKKGQLYFRQGKYENAASVFQVILDKYPKNTLHEKASAWKQEALDQMRDTVEQGEIKKVDSVTGAKPPVTADDLEF